MPLGCVSTLRVSGWPGVFYGSQGAKNITGRWQWSRMMGLDEMLDSTLLATQKRICPFFQQYSGWQGNLAVRAQLFNVLESFLDGYVAGFNCEGKA